jgi:hypothetical protein
MELVFRKYRNGRPDNSVEGIVREVFSQEDKESTVRELQEAGYELEAVFQNGEPV